MSAIRINKNVTLMLPFRRYPLRLSHRLLTSLGGVSRFILRALEAGLTLDALADITGLSDATLMQQLAFLAQHHFVQIDSDDPHICASLSNRGRRMIEVERLLQRGEQSIWLDAFTLKRHAVHLIANPDPEQLLPDPIGQDFSPYTVAVVPVRGHSYHAFDEVGRLRTLLNPDVLTELLGAFWPDANKLIDEEIDHWEYTLGRQEGQELDYLSLTFAQDTLTLELFADQQSVTLPMVLLPMLDLTTHFSRVEAFPWPVTVPTPNRQILELVSYGELPELAEQPPAAAGDYIVLPVSLDGGPPAIIGGEQLPSGMSATLSVRHFQVRCQLDEEAFHHQLHERDGVRLFSAQHRVTKTEAFA